MVSTEKKTIHTELKPKENNDGWLDDCTVC